MDLPQCWFRLGTSYVGVKVRCGYTSGCDALAPVVLPGSFAVNWVLQVNSHLVSSGCPMAAVLQRLVMEAEVWRQLQYVPQPARSAVDGATVQFLAQCMLAPQLAAPPLEMAGGTYTRGGVAYPMVQLEHLTLEVSLQVEAPRLAPAVLAELCNYAWCTALVSLEPHMPLVLLAAARHRLACSHPFYAAATSPSRHATLELLVKVWRHGGVCDTVVAGLHRMSLPENSGKLRYQSGRRNARTKTDSLPHAQVGAVVCPAALAVAVLGGATGWFALVDEELAHILQ